MTKQDIHRRDFLKQAGLLIMGVVLMPWQRLVSFFEPPAQKKSSMKEARYYTRGDDLAG